MAAASAGETLLSQIGGSARPAGSTAEADARAVCASLLSALGFVVTDRPFSYSAFPGTCGTPVAGLILILASGVVVAGAVSGGQSIDYGLAAGFAIVIGVAVWGWWLGRYGTVRMSTLCRRGVNLEGRRGVPAVWLVAHIDSKSQPISLLGRAVASIIVAKSWVLILIAWLISGVVPIPEWLFVGLAGCGALASVPLLLSTVGARGTGALDNASGVAVVLRAAAMIDPAAPVGVLVTSAEELGLAGARAWVESASPAVAINCDGVDDGGRLTITAAGSGRRLVRSLQAAGIVGSDIRIRPTLPGVLMDSSAFADKGWAAFTVSQGTSRSLARIHTAEDTLGRMSGTGVENVAATIASLAGAIIARGAVEKTGREVVEGNGKTTIE